MSKVIEGIKYADSHEWVKVEGNVGIIGISDYAQHSLGDIVYVDLPSEGEEISKGEEFGAVESVKAASDLYSPVSGTIIEINSALESEPELINQDAYGSSRLNLLTPQSSTACSMLLHTRRFVSNSFELSIVNSQQTTVAFGWL